MEHQDEYRDAGNTHPVDASLLLAVICGQHLENEAFVRQHLASCVRCQEDYARLQQTCATLDVRRQMTRYQRYPELPVSQLMDNARQGYSQRRFSGRRAARYANTSRSSVMRLAVPAGVLIALMAIIMIALAVEITKFVPHPTSPGGGIHRSPGLSSPTTGVAPMPTPQPGSKLVITVTPGVTATTSPKGTPAREPTGYIYDCTPETPIKYNFLKICGQNFRPGTRVILFAAGASGQAMPIASGPVDQSGAFSTRLSLPPCLSGTVTIYVEEITGRRLAQSNTLTVTLQGCGFS